MVGFDGAEMQGLIGLDEVEKGVLAAFILFVL